MTKIKSKVFYGILIFICAQFIIWTTAYAVAFKKPGVFSLSGKNSISYNVVYLDNDIFSDGVRPAGTYDLLSYTDYIEILSTFDARFSQPADIAYNYTAKETFYIKQQKTSDNNTNPVVYQRETIFTNLSGELKGQVISWNGESPDIPGGTYDINFDEHINVYRKFIEDHDEMSGERDFTVEKNIQFTAELLVEFMYNIQANGINQTFTRGVKFPLSLEVYLPEFVGEETISASVEVSKTLTNPIATICVLCVWYALNIFGICFGIKKLRARKDPLQREIEQIFKRYSDEIVMSACEIEPDLSAYEVLPVASFKELVKLSATTSKPILCYQDDEKVDFTVFVDEFAYCFTL